jgi:hypothetical protein
MPTLKEFRRQISVLKKQGLVPKTVKLRTVKPTTKIGRSKASTIVTKFDDVISGKQTAVKPSAERVKQFKQAGYEIVNGHVMIPHHANERVIVRDGEVVIQVIGRRGGLRRVQIPVRYKDLPQWFKDNPKWSKPVIPPNIFGFKLFGNNSSELNESLPELIALFDRYKQEQGLTDIQQQELYRNLEIVILDDPNKWTFPSERKSAMSKRYNREHARRFRESLKRKPEHVQQKYRDKNAEAAKAYRARLKKKRKLYKVYKAKARKRSAKSYKNRMGKK